MCRKNQAKYWQRSHRLQSLVLVNLDLHQVLWMSLRLKFRKKGRFFRVKGCLKVVQPIRQLISLNGAKHHVGFRQRNQRSTVTSIAYLTERNSRSIQWCRTRQLAARSTLSATILYLCSSRSLLAWGSRRSNGSRVRSVGCTGKSAKELSTLVSR